MPVIEYTEDVHVPLDAMYRLFMDKTRHPERYTEDMHDVKILEDKPDHILREMTLMDMRIRQRVTWDPIAHVVKFTTVDNPNIEGSIWNAATALTDDSCRVTFTMNFNPKGDFVLPDMNDCVAHTLHRCKAVAEAEAAAATGKHHPPMASHAHPHAAPAHVSKQPSRVGG